MRVSELALFFRKNLSGDTCRGSLRIAPAVKDVCVLVSWCRALPGAHQSFMISKRLKNQEKTQEFEIVGVKISSL